MRKVIYCHYEVFTIEKSRKERDDKSIKYNTAAMSNLIKHNEIHIRYLVGISSIGTIRERNREVVFIGLKE